MLNTLMSVEKTNENTCKECDDPCDDCTSRDLTAWITPPKLDKKELDKSKK
jgi:hypothetical protein